MGKQELITTLKAYIEYRRQDLEHRMERLGDPVSIGTVAQAEIRDYLRRAMAWIGELGELLSWAEAGEPAFMAPLTEADKTAWRAVRAKGYDVPPEIEAQL